MSCTPPLTLAATVEQIDAILPQTQCGLCGYKGCQPYAEALAIKQASINLCPPGGIDGLLSLAQLLKEDATPFLAEMAEKAKPTKVATIREAECIGCTKCIQACPVDAILGGAKQMHTVITAECTGCELCIAPCPVDCIDLIPSTQTPNPKQYRDRYHARTKRLLQQTMQNKPVTAHQNQTLLAEKKDYIQAALLRAKNKR